jgi:hypothetical protein
VPSSIPRETLFGDDIDEVEGERLLTRLLTETYRTAKAVPTEQLREELDRVRKLVLRTLTLVEAPGVRVLRARQVKWVRLVSVPVFVAFVVWGGSAAARRLASGPDLAWGRPWHTSSAYSGFDIANHDCDGSSTDIFFHTARELNPWVEFDLGRTESISRIVVRNREVPYDQRVIPLSIDLSDNDTDWTTVAVANRTFDWRTFRFPERRARYVRFQAKSDTSLHLRNVEIYRR